MTGGESCLEVSARAETDKECPPQCPHESSPSTACSQRGVTETGPVPVDRSKVPHFLEPYGYIARDSLDWWESPVPEIRIQVTGHSKHAGHKFYHVDCSLNKPGQWHSPYLSWRCSRRLTQIRAGLHDMAKQELGSSYRVCFDGVHFASRLAPAGTTQKLNTWCQRLANSINSKSVAPVVAAFTLRALGAPDMDVHEGMPATPPIMAPTSLPESGGSPLDVLNPFHFEVVEQCGLSQEGALTTCHDDKALPNGDEAAGVRHRP
mmetsp:Transcript_119494/g.232587  ORF Transcript_119494/g.232587 Transcript_119494/m.232587 type:complete len:263 (-) Transcript_119494:65-853(-)